VKPGNAIRREERPARGIRFSIDGPSSEVARAAGCYKLVATSRAVRLRG
jgi:hypothetical protein